MKSEWSDGLNRSKEYKPKGMRRKIAKKLASTVIIYFEFFAMLIQTWRRSSTADRELHLTSILTDESLCTAAMGIVFVDDELVLSHMNRGRDLPGGHIELGESVLDWLAREIDEEAGVRDFEASLFAERKLINHTQKINKATGKPYPAISYISYYLVEAKQFDIDPSCEEIIAAKAFSLADEEAMNCRARDVILMGAAMRRW